MSTDPSHEDCRDCPAVDCIGEAALTDLKNRILEFESVDESADELKLDSRAA